MRRQSKASLDSDPQFRLNFVEITRKSITAGYLKKKHLEKDKFLTPALKPFSRLKKNKSKPKAMNVWGETSLGKVTTLHWIRKPHPKGAAQKQR